MGYVYKITNILNNKVYIGITNNPERRFYEHKNRYKDVDTKLYRAFRKYGLDNFKFEVIENCKTDDKMFEREIYWIGKYNSLDENFGYNSKGGGDYRYQSDETKIKFQNSLSKCGPRYGKKYKNVVKNRVGDGYTAKLMYNSINYNFGTYRTEIEAAWAHDNGARKHLINLENPFLNFPNGKTKELIKELLATKRLLENYRYVHWGVEKTNRKYANGEYKYVARARDTKKCERVSIAFGKKEFCEEKLNEFIKEKKSCESAKNGIVSRQVVWEKLHGSIYNLYTEEELNEAIKNELGKFE